MSKSRRIMFLMTSIFVFIGIWLTGWDTVHWFLYVPPVLFCIFGLTGICPATLMNKEKDTSPKN